MEQRKDVPCVGAPCCSQHAEEGCWAGVCASVWGGDVLDVPNCYRIASRRAPRGGFTRRLAHRGVPLLIRQDVLSIRSWKGALIEPGNCEVPYIDCEKHGDY